MYAIRSYYDFLDAGFGVGIGTRQNTGFSLGHLVIDPLIHLLAELLPQIFCQGLFGGFGICLDLG